jgi:hypothetical protein
MLERNVIISFLEVQEKNNVNIENKCLRGRLYQRRRILGDQLCSTAESAHTDLIDTISIKTRRKKPTRKREVSRQELETKSDQISVTVREYTGLMLVDGRKME